MFCKQEVTGSNPVGSIDITRTGGQKGIYKDGWCLAIMCLRQVRSGHDYEEDQ